jgi:hypothetical protein
LLFDSATNDLKVAIGDDLTIVVPPVGLCAGTDTNRVRVLNAKTGSIDQTIIHNDKLIGTVTAINPTRTISNIPRSSSLLFRDSYRNPMTGELKNITQVINTRVHAVIMSCQHNTAETYFTPEQKGHKYDLTGTCTYGGAATYTATDLGEYGN